MPIYDYVCKKCGEFDQLAKFDEKVRCPVCNKIAKKIICQTAPSFTLKFNPKTDMCDFDGNRSRYWDDWKKLSPAEKKKQRIPEKGE